MANSNLLEDARQFPMGWRIWFWLLLLVNLGGPVLFITHREAQVLLGGYALAAIAIVALHRRLGWVRLLGIGHLPVAAVLPWLLYRCVQTEPSGVFSIWLLIAVAVNAVCIVIDTVDVVRYACGDRKPVVGDS